MLNFRILVQSSEIFKTEIVIGIIFLKNLFIDLTDCKFIYGRYKEDIHLDPVYFPIKKQYFLYVDI